MASSLSDTESLDILGLAPSSPYTASLQPLRRQGQESPKAVLLAPDALMEQFERAQQYVARHPEDFSLERLSSLQASPGSTGDALYRYRHGHAHSSPISCEVSDNARMTPSALCAGLVRRSQEPGQKYRRRPGRIRYVRAAGHPDVPHVGIRA